MSSSAVSISDICQYSRCPRSYWLSRVEEVPPTVTGPRACEAALTSIILDILREGIHSQQEAIARYEMEAEERFLSVDWTCGGDPAQLLADGKRWINLWWLLEKPSIKAKHAGAETSDSFKFKLSGQKKLKAKVQIVDRGYLGWIRCAPYRLPVRELRSSLYYNLASTVSGVANNYVLVFAHSSGELVRRRWVMQSGERAETLRRADLALYGIKRKIYPAVDLEAGWCTKQKCLWFKACKEDWKE